MPANAIRMAVLAEQQCSMPAARSPSLIDPLLIQAYRQAEYRVLGDRAMVLRIDVASAALAGLHRALNVDCSAFITVCNPFSQQTAAAVNRAQQALLAAEMRSRDLQVVDAIGVDPAGHWPDEPGFLVPGMSEQEARQSGARFAQNAVVWSGSDATPRLILLR
jgi:hypothetical protein